jgi:hypothetical protein
MLRAVALVVVYDYGSIAPLRLAAAATQNDCLLAFVSADSDHSREMLPVLRMLGPVVDMTGRRERDVINELRSLAPAGIVTFSESQIALTARLAAALGLSYHNVDDVGSIIDKEHQRRRLHTRGVDSVRFRRITSPVEIDGAIADVGLPAVVKPATGASSKLTTEVHTVAAATRAVNDVLRRADDDENGRADRHALLEELLPGRPVEYPWGDYVAVDCVACGGEARPVFVTSKFALAAPFRERGGYGQLSTLPDAELHAATSLACRAVTALGIRSGIADVELKLTPTGPRVIEVNGRLGGWVDDLAMRSATADPADVAIKAALGRDILLPARGSNQAIAFHYLIIPPMSASRVLSVRDSLFTLMASPLVDRVSIMKRPGADVSWRTGTDSSVASVLGTVDSHGQLVDLVSEIERINWIEYEHVDLGEDHVSWPDERLTR